MTRGRPRTHPDPIASRRAANARAAERARADGIVQRSVKLPASSWARIRALRSDEESSDAQTLARILARVFESRRDILELKSP